MVPWDNPGVPGGSISAGCNSRILLISVSGHMGFMQLPYTSGTPRTCQNAETFSMTVCFLRDLTYRTATLNQKPSGGNLIETRSSARLIWIKAWQTVEILVNANVVKLDRIYK